MVPVRRFNISALDSKKSFQLYWPTFARRIDDIEDTSNLRRGIPAAHVIYGIPQTISCVNYVQSTVFQHVLALDHPQVTSATV